MSVRPYVWLYAVLRDDAAGGPRRRLAYQQHEREDEVPADVARLPKDAAVHLRGVPGRWTEGHRVPCFPWPADMPSLAALRAAGPAPTRVRLAFTGPATTRTVDADGRPCEIRDAAGPLRVVSYAGYELNAFDGREVDGLRMELNGRAYLVLRADAEAALDVPAPPTAHRKPPAARPPARDPAPAAEPPPVASPSRAFTWTVPADAFVWADGVVTPTGGPAEGVGIPCPAARALFEPVKDELARFLGHPLRVIGEEDGRVEVRVPASLSDFLHELPAIERRRYVAGLRAGGAVRLGEVRDRLVGPGAPDEEVLGVPELGFGPRADAFRWLFLRRDRAVETWAWPGRAVLVPLAMGDGAPLLAWEVVKEDNATYLFRPRDEPGRAAVRAWISEGHPRHALLRDAALKARLAYVTRVKHIDEDARLVGWARKMREHLDAP